MFKIFFITINFEIRNLLSLKYNFLNYISKLMRKTYVRNFLNIKDILSVS